MIQFRNNPDDSVEWYEPLGADIRWYNLNFYIEQEHEWKIFSSVERDSLWKIYNDRALDILWYIRAHLERDTGWKVFNQRDPNPTWKIFNQIDQSHEWKIYTDIQRELEWKIFRDLEYDTTWKLFTDYEWQIMWQLIGPAYIPLTSNRCKPTLFSNIALLSDFNASVNITGIDKVITAFPKAFLNKATKRII